jgi:DNA-binding response OmpR family regulator
MDCRRVLVVDDREDNAEALGSLLTLAGYEITIETDGLAVAETAAAIRPHAVLLDLGMPEVTGYDVCRQLRDSDWGRSLLIIAVTGWTRESDRAEARRAGFDYYLLKPVELKTIDTLLKGHDRRAARG